MTRNHIAAFYFGNAREAAKKRVRKLLDLRFIAERPRLVNEPSILFITRRGLQLLNDRGILSEYPSFSLRALEKRSQVSKFTLLHELSVIDVKMAFTSAISALESHSITRFSTWPRLHEFTTIGGIGPIVVRPDGFISFKKETDRLVSESHFFLEVDRGTESLGTLVERANHYRHHYTSGEFAERNGGSKSAFKQFPFRVLMVFNTLLRRNNVALRLLQHTQPILTHVCLSTLPEVLDNPLGPVWIRPVDYRDATRDSESPTRSYEVNENLVGINRHCLLG